MLIVVEGCDGTGKTTFVNLLADLIRTRMPTQDLRVLHYGPPKRHPLEEYELDLEWYRPGQDVHLIIDRLHWGEVIYGPIYRGKDGLGIAGFRHVELFLQARGGVLVHCNPSEGIVRRNLTTRGENYLKSQDVKRVLDEYLDLHAKALMTTVHFNVLPDKFDAEETLRLAMHWDDLYTPLAPFKTYIGGHRPKYLLLGERRNHPTEQQHEAAFVPYSVTSGRFLLEAMTMDILQDAGIANACEEDVSRLWKVLERPKIVALGKAAAIECANAKVPFSAVPHPQYIRRFHHGQQSEYGRLIQRVLTEVPGDYLTWPKREVETV